jgi:GMP synthase (glutamine-hydrolysing)
MIDGTPGAGQRADLGVGPLYYDLFDSLAPGLTVTITALETLLSEGPALLDRPWDGVIWGADSGLTSVYTTPGPTLDAAQALMERCFARALPQFGSGWGLHLAVLCTGGEVIRAPENDAFPFARTLYLTQSGVTHPLYRGRSMAFMAPCLHPDFVEVMPPQSDVLVLGPGKLVYGCEIRHQAGRFFGLQYQPEADLREIALFCQRHSPTLVEAGWFADSGQAAAFSRRCLECLMTNRADLRLGLGIDRQMMDDVMRQNELRNWLYGLCLDPRP